MNRYASRIETEGEREDRLNIARTLYNALVAKYPDRLITLCDDRGRVLSQRMPRHAAAGSGHRPPNL
jgi:hypothetical protein